MATFSINALLNKIHNDHKLVLPDIQRDFVWTPEKIRLFMDSIMRGFPFGALLFWQTRYLGVRYREFICDHVSGLSLSTKDKDEGAPLEMVLDGQQRLQSLYIAAYGSLDGRRLYFNVTSGPSGDGQVEDGIGDTYRFEFWSDTDTNRPKRLVLVSKILSWPAQNEDKAIRALVGELALVGDDADRAAQNMRLLRTTFNRTDLVLVETIDESASDASMARTMDEVLEIFVRVNQGGTPLTKSDLMFSLIKRKWADGRREFNEIIAEVEKNAGLGVNKDFIIRGLLTVADAPPSFDVDNVRKHWSEMEKSFDRFSTALRSAIDFVQSSEVGILSASLFEPTATLFPVVYYLFHHKNGSVPDDQRQSLRALVYFLLFNRFLRLPEARIRYLRAELEKAKGAALPLSRLLNVVAARQTNTFTSTSLEMLNSNQRLALNMAQPGLARQTLSWQARAEVDHIFPQSVFRAKHPELVDDIGNKAYLGKLRNIRKSNGMPWDYFAGISDDELLQDFLVDRKLLAEGKFPEFVADRRARLVAKVKTFLGR